MERLAFIKNNKKNMKAASSKQIPSWFPKQQPTNTETKHATTPKLNSNGIFTDPHLWQGDFCDS